MALHMADNGYYGIKIHPKKNGDEIVVENLKAILAQYGDVKLFQLPNKYLAFAYYEQHEEARTCLNNMRISQDYAVSPGWPKQTTADEKSKTSFKPTVKEDRKEENANSIDHKKDENKTNDYNKTAKPIKNKQSEENNEEISTEDKKIKTISNEKIRVDKNNNKDFKENRNSIDHKKDNENNNKTPKAIKKKQLEDNNDDRVSKKISEDQKISKEKIREDKNNDNYCKENRNSIDHKKDNENNNNNNKTPKTIKKKQLEDNNDDRTNKKISSEAQKISKEKIREDKNNDKYCKENRNSIDHKKDNENNNNNTPKTIKKKQLEDNNKNTTDKKKLLEDEKEKISKSKIRADTNNNKLNINNEEENENNKNDKRLQNEKKESKLTKHLKQIIKEQAAINLNLKEKKEREKNENVVNKHEINKDIDLNSENQVKGKYKKNRCYSVDRGNNYYNRIDNKNNDNFGIYSKSQKDNKLVSSNMQKKTKETVLVEAEERITRTEPTECCLVSALDFWIAENIKNQKNTKLASYVVILNLPIVINAGTIYDLCKSFVTVLQIDIKYPDNIYLPPHAFVYTKTKEDADLLKRVLNGKTLKTKVLMVETQEELEK